MPEGHIRGLSQHYADGLERMEIWIDRNLAISLPHCDNQRISVTLKIGETIYAAASGVLLLTSTFGFALI